MPAPEIQATLARYVYGVTRATSVHAAEDGGVCGAEVLPVVLDELAALTSPLPSSTIRARRRDLAAHSEVLGDAFARDTVIPLRFGAVFEDVDSVSSDFLAPHYETLTRLLHQFDGLAELRVTAFYRDDAIFRELVENDATIGRLREVTRAEPAAAGYGLRVELGELVAQQLAASLDRDADRLLSELRPFTRDVVVEERLAEMQVLRASLLIERANLDAMDRTLDAFARTESERMVFKYVGPLPPYSFVSFDGDRP